MNKQHTHNLSRANDVSRDVMVLVKSLLQDIFPGNQRSFTVTAIHQVPGSPQKHNSVYITGHTDQTGMKAVVQPGDNGTAVLVVIYEDNRSDQEAIWRPIIQKLKVTKGVWRPKEKKEDFIADSVQIGQTSGGRSEVHEKWQQFLGEIPEYLKFLPFSHREAWNCLGKSFGMTKADTFGVLDFLTKAGYLEDIGGEWRFTEAGAMKARDFGTPVPDLNRSAELQKLIDKTRDHMKMLLIEELYRR